PSPEAQRRRVVWLGLTQLNMSAFCLIFENSSVMLPSFFEIARLIDEIRSPGSKTMKVRCGMAATLLLAFSLGLPEAATTKGIKGGVPFDYVPNSSLIVVPVTINKHGPYKLLLDTGTTR